ncbi:MAG: hypothetical protein NTY77_15020 [Elusimicrobia bacterium]|nr:hypothetical protein [Elusimicrobiota bacterium]
MFSHPTHRTHRGLKPQDVLVLLKLLASQGKQWRMVDLAMELGISQSEVSLALGRAGYVGLFNSEKGELVKAALEEFLLHGLKYVFPAEFGMISRGIPTSHSAPPLAQKIVSGESDQYVWPHPDGEARGQSISPLCEWAPQAARKDPRLYELLALVDALRVGRARERALAAEELHKRLHAA